MLINVLKFGGTSLANLKRLETVVKIVEKRIKDNASKIILVVSAMSGVTNELIKEFKKIRNEISDPEYDVIVSTGEQSSSALLSSLLNKKKIESILFASLTILGSDVKIPSTSVKISHVLSPKA